MKRILFCASTVTHINNFHLPYLKAFHDMGYEVHVAVNEVAPIQWADKVFEIPFHKSFISFKNISALIRTRKLLKTGKYEKISSNTTLAGLIVRLSALFIKARPRIYHIVHGYHFNIDSGLKKLVYLIPEKIASYVSDIVMVMNREDYDIASKYKLYKYKLCYIDGIGINENRIIGTAMKNRAELRSRLGLSADDFLFVNAAEFSKRKNQQLLIHAFANYSFEKGVLLFAGDGAELEKCKELAAKQKQADRILFLGYVKDVPGLYSACDAVVSASRSEGLPFNILEAMGCGLPVIASDIKGHRELVEHGITGLLFESDNGLQLAKCMKSLYSEPEEKLLEYGSAGANKVGRFSIENVLPKVMECYMS